MKNYFFNVIFLKDYEGIPLGTRCYATPKEGMWEAEFYDNRKMQVPVGYLAYSAVHHSHAVYREVHGKQEFDGYALLLEDGEDEALVQYLSHFEQRRVPRQLLKQDISKPVLSVRDFEVGKYYMAVCASFGTTEILKCWCDETTVPEGFKYKYLGHRIWAHPENPSAMTRWIEFKEIEMPYHLSVLGQNIRNINKIGAQPCQ